jgi:DNA-binding transcriptional ArsR family regulator
VLSQGSIRDLKVYYRALGDVSRLRIVQLLATEGDETVHAIAARVSRRRCHDRSGWLSFKRAGVVRTRRMGREVICSFDRETFSALHERGFRTLMNRAHVE